MKQGVSIIICCYNSELLVEKTLQHVAAQNFDVDLACEIIIVDNASTDNTAGKAKSVWAENSNAKIKLIITYQPKPGLAYAREKGIDAASYEYLVFCDDDNWLDKNYINNVDKLFNLHPEAVILGGVGIATMEDENLKPFWFDKFYQSYATGLQAEQEAFVNNVYGAGMAVRKSVLKKVIHSPMLLHDRAKNQLSSGGDSELCFRMLLAGYKILFSPQLIFNHFIAAKRLNWDYLKKLHTGLAESHVVINLYNLAIHSNNFKLPASYWLKKAFYYWGIYLKYWPKHYAVYKNREGTIEEIHHLMWKVIAWSYIKYNISTIGIYRNIVHLKASQIMI